MNASVVDNPSVVELEAEVTKSRERLRASLESLRSPERVAGFKAELRSEKDDLVHMASDAAREAAGHMIEDVKARAMANPAAALSIGAGVAWYLLRHPPISSALIGLGIFSLVRTQPTGASNGVAAQFGSQMKYAADTASSTAKAWADAAAEVVQENGDRFVSNSRMLVHDAQDQISVVSARVAMQSTDIARMASEAVYQSWENVSDVAAEVPRDQVLFGAAAVSVLAAVGIAFSRRQQQG
jgi:hypothetical protein